MEGVKIIKLTGTNNFAVKKLLLHDDLDSNYLIYCPITYTSDEDNWLQDIEYYSEPFRADFISMQMDELNIAPSAAMRKTVKLYAKFFDSKERIQKLRRIGRDYQTPLQLHIDIMAVLAGLSEGSAQALDFRQRVLSPPQSGGHHPAGRAAQLILNFPQPGSAGIELFPLLRQIRFPGAPVRFIPLLRQTQQPSVICHVPAPSLHVFPGVARRLCRLLRRGLVRPFDLLRGM